MLLTGQPPFEGGDEAAITESIQRNKIMFEKKFWADKTEAKTLIKHMLRVKRKKRYTCDQVLASPWLKKFASEKDADRDQMISGEVIKSMTLYADMEKLKKTAIQVVAFTLVPAEIKNLRDQFKALDTDGSGTLSLKEFRVGMERHEGMDRKSIADLFAKIDSDHTGLISYSEFISASLSTSVHLNEDRLSAAFDKLDPDASGYIDSHELGALLKQTVVQSDIDKMIADADSHGENDGKISKQEFIALVQKNT